jgi:REP element-mobilizing transposase RayT
MPFRRQYVPGAVVFITQVVDYRIPIFRDDEFVNLLRAVLREAQARYPFRMLAYVFLPDQALPELMW